MEQRFEQILSEAIRIMGTDVHFRISDDAISISIRGIRGLQSFPAEKRDIQLLNYLLYKANLDVSNLTRPQCGSFSYYFEGVFYDFRLAVLQARGIKNAVLRILNCRDGLSLQQLTPFPETAEVFLNWLKRRSGLILFSGLTGSGKTTTIYSLLKMIPNRSIFSLEDPIEAINDNIVQIEINTRVGLTYDEGIKQILRHNPDILLIGEIRDETTARMTVRAALTGCLVVSSLHSSSTVSAFNRLLELGVNRDDLLESLCGLVNQQLVRRKDENGYYCIYDVLDQSQIRQGNIVSNMKQRMTDAISKGFIAEDTIWQ